MNQLLQGICTDHLGVKPAPAKVREAYTRAQAPFDGADVVARYMERMTPDELRSIVADVEDDAAGFAMMVKMYAVSELEHREWEG